MGELEVVGKLVETISFTHRRTARVSIMPAVDEGKGIDSRLSPINPHILLVPPSLLGSHEATIGNPADPQIIPTGFSHNGFESIDFSNGWNGQAIAVAASSMDLYQALANKLEGHARQVGLFEAFTYGDLGVLDGHHRNASAEQGPVRLKYVPIQLIPFPADPNVSLSTWHEDGICWTPEQVFECFKDPSKVADAKRTKFQVRGRDGNLYRIMHMQPIVRIPLEDLV